MTTESEKQITNWINQQNVNWAAFTLKSPRINKRLNWEPLLKVFFTELERKYVKSTVRKHRAAAKEPMLQRVVWMGGERSTGIALHAHGLVELQDGGLEKLKGEMEKAWQHTVKKYFVRKHSVDIHEETWMSETKVWIERFEHRDAYAQYLNRLEGYDLGFGVQKVVLSATSLKPYATCFVKLC